MVPKETPMRRSITEKLLSWKQSKRRKPLVLCGARQMGKTYSLMAFGKEHYQEVASINFFHEDAAAVLKSGYDARRVLSDIRVYRHIAQTRNDVGYS